MNYISLEKHLNSEELNSIYLFYGEEEFLISNSIKKIKKKFGELLKGINYIVLDEDSISELIPNIESPAFGYDKKLIIVNDSKIFKKDGRKKTLTPIQEKILNYIKENVEIIKLLVELGANVNAKNEYNRTPLQIAENQGFTGIAALLKNFGAIN